MRLVAWQRPLRLARGVVDPLGLGGANDLAVEGRHQAAELDLGSRTYSHDYKPLAAPNHVRQADNDTALLIYGRLPPAWLQLRPWYRDRALKRIVNTNGNARTPATLAPASAAAPEELA